MAWAGANWLYFSLLPGNFSEYVKIFPTIIAKVAELLKKRYHANCSQNHFMKQLLEWRELQAVLWVQEH